MVTLEKKPHTVCLMTPCCEKSEPGYVPPPVPYYVRTPGSNWGCEHTVKRVPRFQVYQSEATARAVHHAWTHGWYALDGWVAPGVLGDYAKYTAPEVFYIQRIVGSLNTHYEYGRVNTAFPFPSVELAIAEAEKRRLQLFGIADREGAWVHCSYARPGEKPGGGLLGATHEPGDWA